MRPTTKLQYLPKPLEQYFDILELYKDYYPVYSHARGMKYPLPVDNSYKNFENKSEWLSCEFKKQADLIIENLVKITGAEKFFSLKKFFKIPCLEGENRKAIDEIKATAEILYLKLVFMKEKGVNLKYYLPMINNAQFLCAAGTHTNLLMLSNSIDHNLDTQVYYAKYSLLENFAGSLLAELKLSYPLGEEIHIVHSMLNYVRGIAGLSIHHDMYANYEDRHLFNQFKSLVEQYFKEGKIFPIINIIANSILMNFPTNLEIQQSIRNPETYQAQQQLLEVLLKKINPSGTTSQILKIDEPYGYEDNYEEIIQCMIIQELEKHGYIEEEAKMEKTAQQSIRLLDSWYLYDSCDNSYTKVICLNNLSEFKIGGICIGDIVDHFLSLNLANDLKKSFSVAIRNIEIMRNYYFNIGDLINNDEQKLIFLSDEVKVALKKGYLMDEMYELLINQESKFLLKIKDISAQVSNNQPIVVRNDIFGINYHYNHLIGYINAFDNSGKLNLLLTKVSKHKLFFQELLKCTILDSMTPLMFAVKKENDQAVQLILNKSKAAGIIESVLSYKDLNKDTYLKTAMQKNTEPAILILKSIFAELSFFPYILFDELKNTKINGYPLLIYVIVYYNLILDTIFDAIDKAIVKGFNNSNPLESLFNLDPKTYNPLLWIVINGGNKELVKDEQVKNIALKSTIGVTKKYPKVLKAMLDTKLDGYNALDYALLNNDQYSENLIRNAIRISRDEDSTIIVEPMISPTKRIKYYGYDAIGNGMEGEELQELLRLMKFAYENTDVYIHDRVCCISKIIEVIKNVEQKQAYIVVGLLNDNAEAAHAILIEIEDGPFGLNIRIIDFLEEGCSFLPQVEELRTNISQMSRVKYVQVLCQHNHGGQCATKALTEILNGLDRVKRENSGIIIERAYNVMDLVMSSNAVENRGYFEGVVNNITLLALESGQFTIGIESLDQIVQLITRAEYNTMLGRSEVLQRGELMGYNMAIREIKTDSEIKREKEKKFAQDKKMLLEAVENGNVNVVHNVFAQYDVQYHDELMNVRNGERGIVLDNLLDIAERTGDANMIEALYGYHPGISAGLVFPVLEFPRIQDPAIELPNPTSVITGFASIFAINSMVVNEIISTIPQISFVDIG